MPLLSRRQSDQSPSPWPIKHPHSSARNYFGLTQVCKQIRTEYRPLWMRNSSVRVKLEALRLWMWVFYAGKHQHQNAPQLLQISWANEDDSSSSERMLDLTPLIQLRAHRPTFTVEFVADALVEGLGRPLVSGELCSVSGEPLLTQEDRQAKYDDWILMQEAEHSYLPALNEFLAHDNARWLSHIRDHKVCRVNCTIDSWFSKPTVFIRFPTDGMPKDDENQGEGIRGYLKKVGILDLPAYQELGVEVSFKV